MPSRSPCWRRAISCSRGCCSTARSSRSPRGSPSAWRPRHRGTRGACASRRSIAWPPPSSSGRSTRATSPRARAPRPHHEGASAGRPRPLARSVVSIREQAAIVVTLLRSAGALSFRELVAGVYEPGVVVARFLSVLELYRHAAISFEQLEPLGRADLALERPTAGPMRTSPPWEPIMSLTIPPRTSPAALSDPPDR